MHVRLNVYKRSDFLYTYTTAGGIVGAGVRGGVGINPGRKCCV